MQVQSAPSLLDPPAHGSVLMCVGNWLAAYHIHINLILGDWVLSFRVYT